VEPIHVRELCALIPEKDGPLSIWEHPIEGVSYTAGSDVSEGILHGDWSVTEIIRNDTTDQVAEIRARSDPAAFGRYSAILACYYNSALLAFETFPAAHGATAYGAALATGYNRLYKRRTLDTTAKAYTDKIGWATNASTHALMVDRVRLALAAGSRIHSTVLLKELLGIRFERKESGMRNAGASGWKAVTKGHDDCHDAFAIALCVRDNTHFEKRIHEQRTPRARAATLQDFAWEEAEREKNHNIKGGPRKGRLFKGY
jgi:hypothetical protein